MITDVATQINTLDMPKSTKANALALLLAVHPENGHAVITWSEVAEMFGGVDKRVAQRHLGTMQKADLIHYSSNGDGLVYVNFKAWLAEKRALSTPNSCTEDTKNVHSEHEKRAPNTPTENDTNDGARVDARKTCIESTKNARGRALPLTRDRLFVRSDLSTRKDDQKQTNKHAEDAPLSEEQIRSVTLLTDVDVGLDAPTAHGLAAQYPFEELLRQVFAWRRELSTGKVAGTGALLTRISRRFGAQIADVDRESDLWRRHMGTDDDSEAARRRKYLPDEYRDIIIG